MAAENKPIPMLLWCPGCGARHVDVGEFATKSHHTHACQTCGHCWRPAVVPTCGVQFLPGFKNDTGNLCEHGVADGDWCPACNREYREAAKQLEAGE